MNAAAFLPFIVLLHGTQVSAQSQYNLPLLNREAAKPQVPSGLEGYFDLGGRERGWLDALLGTRWSPEKPFEADPVDKGDGGVLDLLGLGGGGGGGGGGAGLNGLFSNVGQNILNQMVGGPPPPQPLNQGQSQIEPRKRPSNTSIGGIPNIYPDLPKAPIPQPQIAPSLPKIPKIPTAPQVPTGGLGPTDAGGLPLSLLHQVQNSNIGSGNGLISSGAGSAIPEQVPGGSGIPSAFPPGLPPSLQKLFTGNSALNLQNPSVPTGHAGVPQYPGQVAQADVGGVGAWPAPVSASQDNIVTQVMSIFGLDPKNPQAQPGLDLGAVQKFLGLNSQNQGVLSSVLYNALTDGVIQSTAARNDTNATEIRSKASDALGSNIALIQQLITQPESPFCNPKPVPVTSFSVDAFMGTWYQVLYSPPLSSGPCSMVAYKKLADGGLSPGGPGTVFDTFEYTTEGTPYGRPTISSGYAIVQAPGQLIYRTTSSPTDVNVNILATGPINEQGQYEWAVVSVNCNYPLHVFARDALIYKQKYEAEVNSLLEQKGLTNGFSRLLNVVAPVDSSLCSFPPTLFNINGR